MPKCRNYDYMFDGAINFNQDLSKWKIKEKTRQSYMFRNCPIQDEYKPQII